MSRLITGGLGLGLPPSFLLTRGLGAFAVTQPPDLLDVGWSSSGAPDSGDVFSLDPLSAVVLDEP